RRPLTTLSKNLHTSVDDGRWTPPLCHLLSKRKRSGHYEGFESLKSPELYVPLHASIRMRSFPNRTSSASVSHVKCGRDAGATSTPSSLTSPERCHSTCSSRTSASHTSSKSKAKPFPRTSWRSPNR